MTTNRYLAVGSLQDVEYRSTSAWLLRADFRRVANIEAAEATGHSGSASNERAHQRAVDDPRRLVYSLPTDIPVDELYSRKSAYDRYATTLDDVDSYLPLTHLHRFVTEGRIGAVAPRFQMIYS